MQIVIVADREGCPFAHAIHERLYRQLPKGDLWLFPDGSDSTTDLPFDKVFATQPLVLILCPLRGPLSFPLNMGSILAECSDDALRFFSNNDPELTINLWEQERGGQPVLMTRSIRNGLVGQIVTLSARDRCPDELAEEVANLTLVAVGLRPRQYVLFE